MAKHATFMRATVYTTDGAETQLIVGLCDRMAAKAKFKKGIEDIQESSPGQAEEWMAYTMYAAAKRQAGVKVPFEKWLESYVGAEFDDGEDPGPTPA
jgi:hypothetical protein